MVRRIVSEFHPEKIILFGSHARGVAGPDSDVNLLIVMPFFGSKREKQLEIRLALRNIQIPKDIVVTTPKISSGERKSPVRSSGRLHGRGRSCMPDREKLIVVCKEWLAKADNDLSRDPHTLKLGESCPTDTVCFHAQQCVEKYLKAVLIFEGIDFPKTHDLETLVSLIPAASKPDLSDEEQARLTEYATGARYPGWEEISLTVARRAVAVARRVRRSVRRRLPRTMLRGPRG